MDNLGKNWQLIIILFCGSSSGPISEKNACRNLYSHGHTAPASIRESTFIMPRGGGMKMLRGATEIFSGIKGGALKVLDILRGGGLNFSKFWSSRGLECTLPPP